METKQIVTADSNNSEIVYHDRGYSSSDLNLEMVAEERKRHYLVVSLFRMLQRPASSVIVPSFSERNM